MYAFKGTTDVQSAASNHHIYYYFVYIIIKPLKNYGRYYNTYFKMK